MRRLAPILALALLGATAPDPRARLTEAKRAAVAAAARAAQLDRAAAGEAAAAREAALAAAAMTARLDGAQADVAAARARVAIVGELIAQQRRRLATEQGPLARLIAALQSLAARPALVAVAQPGSVDDLVHVRAVLGTAIPVVQARTAGVRAELDRTRALERGAVLAARGLAAGRQRLEEQRIALVRLEAQHRYRGRSLNRDALYQSDRALALGERARDLVGLLSSAQDAAAVEARLATLAGPLPRPGDTDALGSVPAAPYRLPVVGRVVTGLGEISDSGVRSRGLTFATAPAAAVVAPAGGTVRYAAPFRGYGRVVVIDHGDGWTTALAGLGGSDVAVGDRVRADDAIGRAGADPDPRVTVELRRRGRPVDLTALLR